MISAPFRSASGLAGCRCDWATWRRIQLGPEMRRGVTELNGEGEVAGGVVILRSGKNARAAIVAVKAKLAELQRSLPHGVEIVPTYDRSKLIDRAVENLTHKLIEEFIVVAVVCGLFLWHLRSAGVAIISLPLGILIAFIVMRYQGVSANIMSLGGVAIAIGAMVDAAVVMIENAHKRVEVWTHAHPGQSLQGEAHWRVMTEAAVEVGPALFFSLLIITLSFIPVFTLEAQEGRLFGPLALTKTYAMAAAAGLVGYIGAGPHGVLDSRENSGRDPQSSQPGADPSVPSATRSGVGEAGADHRGGGPCAALDGVAIESPGRRVHAAAGGRGSAVYALRASGTVGGKGFGTAAADRPDDQDRA